MTWDQLMAHSWARGGMLIIRETGLKIFRLKPREYVPIVQGNNLMKFGQSKRFYVLDGSIKKDHEEEDEAEEEVEASEEEVGDMNRL